LQVLQGKKCHQGFDGLAIWWFGESPNRQTTKSQVTLFEKKSELSITSFSMIN
jgi:hypothetical protein